MAKNYLYNLVLTIANILFPIITFPYVSRVLGPKGVGEVQLVQAFSQYFILICALGIPIYGVREIAKAKHDSIVLAKVFTELMIIFLASSIFVFSIYLSIIIYGGFLKKIIYFF